MEKKLYFVIDNDEVSITATLDGCMAFIIGDMEQYNEDTQKEDMPFYTITPLWLTEDEFDRLPEANL